MDLEGHMHRVWLCVYGKRISLEQLELLSRMRREDGRR